MTAVPARVAGVREIYVVCPRPEPAVMAAALVASPADAGMATPQGSELTYVEARAASMSDTCPACSAPIVGTSTRRLVLERT